MDILKNFLEKYKKLANSQDFLKEIIIDIINKKIGINISKNDINIKNNIIYIKKSSAIKSEIFIHKEIILKEINELLPVKVIKNIQ